MLNKNIPIFLLVVFVSISSIVNAGDFKKEIDKHSLYVPRSLGELSLRHSKHGFLVAKDGSEAVAIKSDRLDKDLRGISKNKLRALLKTGAYYLALNKAKNNDEYSLKLQSRVKGGGVVGATVGCYVGKFVVHFVAHSAIVIAGAMTGPAAPATIASLEATFFPIIELASNTAAIAGGILGGVATGPV